MGNAVLLYTGNVCSTPMVEYARLCPGVFVPMREEFDRYMFEKLGLGDQAESILAQSLEALFARRANAYLERPALRKYRPAADLPDLARLPHLLFKWRPFGDDTDQAGRLAAAFAGAGVRPVAMLRRMLLEQAVKVHLSERLYQDRHLQHRTEAMSAGDYAAFLADQRSQALVLHPADLPRIAAIARNFLNRTGQIISRAARLFPGIPLAAVICEDVFRPLIDRARFQSVLRRMLDAPVTLPEGAEPKVRKSGPDLAQCANPELALQDPALQGLEARYQRLVAGLDVISGQAA